METGWTKLSLVSWTEIEIGLKINRNRKWYPNPSTISPFKIILNPPIPSFRLQSLNLIVRDQNHADFHSTLIIIMSHHIRIPIRRTFNFNVISKLKLEVGNFLSETKNRLISKKFFYYRLFHIDLDKLSLLVKWDLKVMVDYPWLKMITT